MLRTLLVLGAPAAPTKSSGLSSPGNGGFSVQLRVTDAQSQKLKWINEFGEGLKFHLELRPPANSADSGNTIETERTMLSDRPGLRGPR